jgi:pimeloyl-ACP methyl ester carboxylesterase
MHQFYISLMVILFHTCYSLQAQQSNTFTSSTITLTVDSNKLYGTLTIPSTKKQCPVMLLIAGSGPTDRNGNQPNMENNAYKELAEELAVKGISTLRYDKRGVGESKFDIKEGNLRFDHFIEDALLWINYLKKDKRFSKVIVAGHSEGSLIGMEASQRTPVDAYISIAGAGKSIDKILLEQLKTALPDSMYYAKCINYLDTLKKGYTLTNADPALASLFRESIQPYMISWIKFDPSIILSRLTMPIFIIQGNNDIQISVENANLLAQSNGKAQVRIVKGMNHVLKLADTDRAKNVASYSDPTLHVVPEFIKQISNFISTL